MYDALEPCPSHGRRQEATRDKSVHADPALKHGILAATQWPVVGARLAIKARGSMAVVGRGRLVRGGRRHAVTLGALDVPTVVSGQDCTGGVSITCTHHTINQSALRPDED